VKHLLDQGSLSMGHARALIGVTDAGALAKQIVAKGLSVRQVEKLVKKHGKLGRPRSTEAETAPSAKNADTRDLETRLEEVLGLKVDISFDGQGGVLSLSYSDLEQLDDVVSRLTRPKAMRPLTADRDPNVLDIEEVLAKRGGTFKPDHSEEAAVSEVHPDPRSDDTGSSGSQDRE